MSTHVPPTAPQAPTRAPGPGPAGPPDAGAVVVGDGSTTRSRVGSRWRRWRFPLALVGIVLLVGLLGALPEPRTSQAPLAPDNPSPSGARAVAQVLGDRGVDVTYVRSTADAVARAVEGSTLLVTGDMLLGPEQVDAIVATRADLVLLDPGPLLDAATTSASRAWWDASDAASTRRASCEDPDALAAGSLSTSGPGFEATGPDAQTCFPAEGVPDSTGAYLAITGDRRVTAFADPRVLRNDTVTEAGNAALVLRALGRHETLIWYVPSLTDAATGEASAPGVSELLPPVAQVLTLQLLVVAAAAALWRGRRLGRVVTEPLPVTVRAAETTRGRARLYRRARSYGHAAAALRAGAAARSAHRLGLPRSAGAPAVIDALAEATGRPNDDVAALLYGPPPKDDRGLAQLARRLDELESEVHRS